MERFERILKEKRISLATLKEKLSGKVDEDIIEDFYAGNYDVSIQIRKAIATALGIKKISEFNARLDD